MGKSRASAATSPGGAPQPQWDQVMRYTDRLPRCNTRSTRLRVLVLPDARLRGGVFRLPHLRVLSAWRSSRTVPGSACSPQQGGYRSPRGWCTCRDWTRCGDLRVRVEPSHLALASDLQGLQALS